MKRQKEPIWKVRLLSASILLFYLILKCLLLGLRVGQVRLIFALPDYLRGRNLNLPKYHACVEWFNSFRAPNPDSQLNPFL